MLTPEGCRMGHQDRLDIMYRLAQERRARLAAERLLEQQTHDLMVANARLVEHARTLSNEVIVCREEVRSIRGEAESLKGQNNRVLQYLNRANHAILKAERRLWESLETIQDGFAVFDGEKRLVKANLAYLALFDGDNALAIGVRYRDVMLRAAEEGLVDTNDAPPEDFANGMY